MVLKEIGNDMDRAVERERNRVAGASVTVAVREALGAYLEHQKQSALLSYWQGNPVPEFRREALILAESFLRELFEADADTLKEWHEYERDLPLGFQGFGEAEAD